MKKNKLILLIVVIALGIGLVIYKGGIFKKPSTVETIKSKDQKEILYWTCGMHPSVKSDKPGKCPICSMDLIPVYKESQAPMQMAQAPTQAPQEKGEYYGCGVKEEGHCPHCDKGIKDAKCICGGHSFIIKGQNIKVCPVCKNPLKKIEKQDLPKEVTVEAKPKKILYYRNPMNQTITSKVPMKDEMGMDYIPVYEETTPEIQEEGAISRVHLSQSQLQLAGIQTQTVSKQRLSKQIRTVGRIAYDPELAVAQEEFLTAIETREKLSKAKDSDVIARAQDILDKSKFRLRLLGMSEEEIAQLEKDRTTQLNLVLPEDKVWVYANVYEYDLSWVKIGREVKVSATAYPGEEFIGEIKSISPVLDPATRSANARIEVDNHERKLKPEMYVDVFIRSTVSSDLDEEGDVLAVPKEAVLDTGLRKIVYVDAGNGTFIGKEIKTGPEATAQVGETTITFYPVLSGLKGDEMVVTKGNFLIDSQSQLTGGMSVLWGGATEIKQEGEIQQETAPVQTQHKH